MSNEMTEALQALAEDRGISVDKLFGIMANALESAYKRMPDSYEYAWVTIDPATFDIRVFAQELDEDGLPVHVIERYRQGSSRFRRYGGDLTGALDDDARVLGAQLVGPSGVLECALEETPALLHTRGVARGAGVSGVELQSGKSAGRRDQKRASATLQFVTAG